MENEGYDFAYLKETVGTPLTQALAQVTLKQPQDPVEFVGSFLLNHVANIRRQSELEEYKASVKLREKTKQEAVQAEETAIAAREAERTQREQSNQEIKDSLLTSSATRREMCQQFLSKICQVTGASSAYIGQKVTDSSDVPKVHWFIASSDTSSVVDQSVSEENGVTFDVFKEEEDPNAQPDDDGNLPPPQMPPYIHIKNVIREPRMVFYGIPKLGAYLAKGFRYQSYLHDEAAIKDEESGEHSSKEAFMVVAVDNLGQAREFSPTERTEFVEWVNVLAIGLENLEKKLCIADKEGKKKEEEDGLALKDKIKENEEKITTELETKADEEKAQVRLDLMTQLVTNSLLDHIQFTCTFTVPYKPPVLYAYTAALCLLGISSTDLINPVTGTPDWEKIRTHLNKDSLKQKIEAFDVSCARVPDQYMEKTNVNDIEAISPVVAALHSWSIAASEAIVAAAEAAAAAEQEQPNEDS